MPDRKCQSRSPCWTACRYSQVVAASGLCWLLLAPALTAQEPLHVRIDALVEAGHVGQPVTLADDEEFVGRVYLDLVGRIPSAAEIRQFLADAAPDKREALIDRLLATPEANRHLTTSLDVMWMERRADKHVPAAEWRAYLYDALAARRPLNDIVREMLATDGSDEKLRPAAKFYLDREVEPNLLTRDVGRMFFGMDVQCAQCHDHPLIDDYKQRDYYGLYAFVSRSSLFLEEKEKNKAYIGESAEGEASFKSVFTEIEGTSLPYVPTGREIEDKIFAKDDAYIVKPDKKIRGIPKYSRRQILAEETTRGDNLAFNRNLANRLWAHLMGRGIVEPVDLLHSDNPPTHPLVLDLLADELSKMQFDPRAFLAQLARTRVYQRSLQIPDQWQAQIESAVAEGDVQPALDEATAQRDAAIARRDEAQKAVSAKRDELAPQKTALRERELAFAEAEKAAREAAAKKQTTEQELAAKKPVAESVSAALAAAQRAAELVPDDEAVKSAVTLLQGKNEKLTAEIAPLETGLPEQQQALQTAVETQSAQQQMRDEAAAQWTSAAAPLHDLQAQLQQAEQEVRAAVNRIELAERRLSDAKLLAEIKPVLAEAESSRATLAQATAELTAAQQQLTETQQRVAQLETDYNAMRQARDTAAAELATATKRHEDVRQAQALVQQATEKLQQASAALPADGGLQSAAQDLASRAEQLTQQVTSAAADVAAREKRMNEINEQFVALETSFNQGKQQLATAQQQASDVQVRHDQVQQQAASIEGRRDEALTNLEFRWTRQAALAPLKPLTPEQLAWSMMQATGILDAQRAASENELKQNAELAADPARLATEIEKHAFGKLEGNVNEFIRLFGGGAGQPQHEFFATVDQALFFANGGVLRSWLSPSGENLTARLIKLEEPAAVAEELYLSVLSRRPNAEEVQRTTEALTAAAENKPAVVQELAWALLTSAEFRFRP